MDWHALEAEAVAAALGTSQRGLTEAQSADRLRGHGPNEVAEAPPTSDLELVLRQLRSPLIAILVAALGLSVALGETLDAGVIAFVLLLDAAVGFVQERQAERSVRALRGLLAPRARVRRDGRSIEIAARDVVPGDVVLLASGQRVVADMRLFEATALLVDESLLTGESAPVLKHDSPVGAGAALGDRTDMAYAGTAVARGRGAGYVVATGEGTEVGAIAGHVRAAPDVETPLQRRVGSLARIVGAVAAISSLLVLVVGVLDGRELPEMFRVAVALAVASVPEGLPVAFTITLAVGVRRMAERRAIVRQLGAVETLGSTSVIGSDKTGTLTEDRMTVREIWAGGTTIALDAATTAPRPGSPLHLTLLAGILANEAQIRGAGPSAGTVGDPTEAALLVAAAALGLEVGDERAARPRRSQVGFEPERRYGASVHDHDGEPTLFVAGAPERVIAMCERVLGEDGPAPLDTEEIRRAVDAMAARGLRVIALAFGRAANDAGPTPAAAARPTGLTFLGLQGMHDPPRPGVRDAIAGCHRAGIRVVMITGDHAGTALSIGREVGIAGAGSSVLTGAEIERMRDDELVRRVGDVPIYARVSPADKLRIVRALRETGHVVAVTGDGVNDAPALKAADVGVAMGRGGTDVAREAADIVLTDDAFVTIYAAIEEGRVTFENLRKITYFLVSTGVGEVLAIVAALALGWPLLLLPAQILWLNLITEGLQDVALAFEPREADALERPPRARTEPILSRLLWERTILAGIVMAAGTLAMFGWALAYDGSLVVAQSAALTTMVLFQTLQVGNARSERTSVFRLSPVSNPFLLAATAGALAVHVAALYWAPLRSLLQVAPVPPAMWPPMIAAALLVVAVVEAHKLLRSAGASDLGLRTLRATDLRS